jgi:hypothetical protein
VDLLEIHGKLSEIRLNTLKIQTHIDLTWAETDADEFGDPLLHFDSGV